MTGSEVMAWWEIGSGDLYEAGLQRCMTQGTLAGAELEKQLEASPALRFLQLAKFAYDGGYISDQMMSHLLLDVWVNGKVPITRENPESIAPALATAIGEILQERAGTAR